MDGAIIADQFSEAVWETQLLAAYTNELKIVRLRKVSLIKILISIASKLQPKNRPNLLQPLVQFHRCEVRLNAFKVGLSLFDGIVYILKIQDLMK